ncbi:Response regulator PleD [Phycisphaerae bacterium RAS1]|nr:Response regulator PleD [Phycisphaerae bacterium RAS1]
MQNSGSRTIVVIDDDEPTRLLVTRTLERGGFRVVACADGVAGMAAIRDMNCGIVMSDWCMPGMDGLEVVRNVRELQELEALGAIHFVLLTANGDKSMIVRGLEAGADDYLVKPFHREEMLARVRAGERILELQEEALRRQIELAKKGLELQQLAQRMRLLADTDALTGLANRRCFFERFSSFWAMSQRFDHPLGCIMLDIDHFKSVNDTHGHEVGDAVLTRVARAVKATVRRYDVCGRVGGEEFAVACPETDLIGTAVLAERLREAVAEIVIAEGDARITPTVSAGAAQRSPDQQTPDALLAEADRLLYVAKQAGRNRVAVAGEAAPPSVGAAVVCGPSSRPPPSTGPQP